MRAARPFAPVLAVALAMASPLSAQERELGLLLGPNLTGTTGGNVEKLDARPGFLAGVTLRRRGSDRVILEGQALFVLHRFYGTRPASTLPPIQAGPQADEASLVYLEVPLLVRFQQPLTPAKPWRPFLVVGPFLGVRLSCSRNLTDAGGSTRAVGCDVPNGSQSGPNAYFPAVYQEVDAGVLGELGLTTHRVAIRVRGEKSLRRLVESGTVSTSPFDMAKMWSASVALEYVLKVL